MRKYLSTTRSGLSCSLCQALTFRQNESSPLACNPCHNKNLYPSLACRQKDLSDGFPAGLVLELQIQPLQRRQTYSTSFIITGQLFKRGGESTFTILLLTQKILNMKVSERITKQSLHLNIPTDEVKGLYCTCGSCGSILS